MPRGFKRSEEYTANARAYGLLIDKRSFMSLEGHMLLFGKDKAAQRERIWIHRNPDRIPLDEGEWHHLRNEHNNFRRCDCLEGGIFISKTEHRKQHAQVQFNKLYSEDHND